MLCKSVALVAHLWSIHTMSVPNSNTFGAGLECDREEVTIQAGYFKNSYGNPAEYVMLGHNFYKRGNLRLGVFGGIVHGYFNDYTYKNVNGGVEHGHSYQAPVWHGMTPMVGVQAEYALGFGLRTAIQLLPVGNGALAHFTVSKSFNFGE